MKRFKEIALTILLTSPALALAQGGLGGTGISADPGAIPEQVNIAKVIATAMNWAFGLLIVLASVFILVAAYYYLTSGGSDEKLAKAKNLIIYAVVSIVVAFLARGIVFIAQTLLKAG